MSISVRNLIQDALTTIKIVAIGQSVEADDAQIAESELNAVISRLNLDDYFSFSNTVVEYTPSASSFTYTLGLSGDIVVERPIRLERVYYSQTQNNNESLFQISVPDIYGKRNLTSFSFPTFYAYEPSLPSGTIHFDSQIPGGTALTIIYKKAIPLVNINSTLDIPSEYNDPIKWTLCEILAGRYGKPIELIGFCSNQAQASLRRIKSIGKFNDPTTRMSRTQGSWRSILTY